MSTRQKTVDIYHILAYLPAAILVATAIHMKLGIIVILIFGIFGSTVGYFLKERSFKNKLPKAKAIRNRFLSKVFLICGLSILGLPLLLAGMGILVGFAVYAYCVIVFTVL